MFFMPIALAALHRYWNGRESRWLALFALALGMNGLVSGYFLLFFGLLVALVIGWLAIAFPDRRRFAAVLVAIGAAALMVWPVISTYRAVQRDLHLRRTVTEVEAFSADLGFIGLGSPSLAVWPMKTPVHRSELAGYPGLAIVGLIVAGALVALRSRDRDRARDTGEWLLFESWRRCR